MIFTKSKHMTNNQIASVLAWGHDRGIIGPEGKGTILGQLQKTLEEINETQNALWFLDNLGRDTGWINELKDGIGDVIVTLILACDMCHYRFSDIDMRQTVIDYGNPLEDMECVYKRFVSLAMGFDLDTVAKIVCHLENIAKHYGLTLVECLAAAYEVISRRTGKMKDGVFVKD